ncbi:MAG: ABC transporter permease [Victivallaceae bacterium]
MLRFILRRAGYSLLILLGVVLLTFVLFNLAAGDPAAAVLGKSPSPLEVETLRRELGADLPVLYGKFCLTECFGRADLERQFLAPKVTWRETGVLEFAPRFESAEPMAMAAVFGPAGGRLTGVENGRIEGDTVYVADSGKPVVIRFAGELRRVEPYRIQANPLRSQFVRALGEIVSVRPEFPYVKVLDFGKTLTTREPIGKILRRGVGPSLGLMLPIFAGELIIGVGLALLAAAYKDRWIDRSLVLLAVGGMSISYLVLIIFAQWYLGYYCNFFPVWGWGSWVYLALPVLVGIVSGLGSNVRFFRTVFVDELKREYLRTAAAKGCSHYRIYAGHLLRNGMIPVITRASASLPFLFTGSLLLETFFGIPGLGFAGIDALNNSDLQLLKALVIVSAMLFVVLNLLADLAYAWADPRIRLE